MTFVLSPSGTTSHQRWLYTIWGGRERTRGRQSEKHGNYYILRILTRLQKLSSTQSSMSRGVVMNHITITSIVPPCKDICLLTVQQNWIYICRFSILNSVLYANVRIGHVLNMTAVQILYTCKYGTFMNKYSKYKELLPIAPDFVGRGTWRRVTQCRNKFHAVVNSYWGGTKLREIVKKSW